MWCPFWRKSNFFLIFQYIIVFLDSLCYNIRELIGGILVWQLHITNFGN